MKGLRFFKWPLITFLFGALIQIFGALFKIRHWPMADELLTISAMICGGALVFAIIKLLSVKKPNP